MKDLQPGHMKNRAAHDFWNNLKQRLQTQGVALVNLNPKGRFGVGDVRMWAAQNGYAVEQTGPLSFRLAVRKVAA